jgi:hypothetical protein
MSPAFDATNTRQSEICDSISLLQQRRERVVVGRVDHIQKPSGLSHRPSVD